MVRWARWKTRSGSVLGTNPWSKALKDLRRRKGNAPKLLAGYQVWQRDHKDEILEETGPNPHISEQNKVAARMFREQDEAVHALAREIAKSEQELLLAAHQEAQTGVPSSNAAEQLR